MCVHVCLSVCVCVYASSLQKGSDIETFASSANDPQKVSVFVHTLGMCLSVQRLVREVAY